MKSVSYFNVVFLLLQADFSIRDSSNRNPVQIAAEEAKFEVMDCLYELSIDDSNQFHLPSPWDIQENMEPKVNNVILDENETNEDSVQPAQDSDNWSNESFPLWAQINLSEIDLNAFDESLNENEEN